MSDEKRKAQPEHRSELDLTLSVDGEGVLAGEGDDVQTVSLN